MPEDINKGKNRSRSLRSDNGVLAAKVKGHIESEEMKGVDTLPGLRRTTDNRSNLREETDDVPSVQ